MKYRDENGKFCSKEKWESLQMNGKTEEVVVKHTPPYVTYIALIVIVVVTGVSVWNIW